MSTTEEVLEVSTFFEDETKMDTNTDKRDTTNQKAALVEGAYLGHIVNARSIIRPVLGKYKARIYNFDVIVADEHARMKHQYEDISGQHVEITGEQFVGRKLIAKGVFNFLDPKEGDDFEGNPTSNKKYSLFCETVGLTAKEEIRTIDGKDIKVKLLPTLTEKDMNGKPVTAILKKIKDEWTNKNGEKMHYSWRVSYFTKWNDCQVKKMEVNPDDLPF